MFFIGDGRALVGGNVPTQQNLIKKNGGDGCPEVSPGSNAITYDWLDVALRYSGGTWRIMTGLTVDPFLNVKLLLLP